MRLTPRPSKKYATGSLVGSRACNGAHRWSCYSNGKDVYRHLYPHASKKYKLADARKKEEAERRKKEGDLHKELQDLREVSEDLSWHIRLESLVLICYHLF